VVIVFSGGLDVKRETALHGEALERVRKQAQRQSADTIASEGECHLGVRPRA